MINTRNYHNQLTRYIVNIGYCLAACLLSACGPYPSVKPSSFAPVLPPQPSAVARTNGAIYQEDREVSLFTDRTAKRIGDLVTIVLNESHQATKTSEVETGKSSSIDLDPATLLGLPVTRQGSALLDNSLTSNNSFKGEGDATQSNTITGTITVTVVDVLYNGTLLVRGEKWMTINQGKEYVQISGLIRPDDVQSDNTVNSTRIANAQITYSGKGLIASSGKQGWLGRFFNSVLSPL